MRLDPGLIIAITLAFFFLVLVMKGIRIVPQAQVLMVERLGRFHKVAESGLNFIFPFIDAVRPFRIDHGKLVRAIDMREQVMDFPPQPVITKDNVTMLVDSVIYFRIMDPRRAMYEIEDLFTAIRQLAITNMRNIMGELDLDDTLTSRDVVNAKLQRFLDEATDVWGVKVTRVELKNINPPQEIEAAMSRQMKAERERRALVTEAEGQRSALILKSQGERDAAIAEAEGRRQAAILDAQGRAQALVEVARAKAEAVKLEFDAIHAGAATPDVIAIRYLESLQQIAQGPANKIFIPYEATAILSSVAQIAEAARVDKGAPPASRA
jgi:regulator of protease activity HflC (stomatin/prohibitin superfamily)